MMKKIFILVFFVALGVGSYKISKKFLKPKAEEYPAELKDYKDLYQNVKAIKPEDEIKFEARVGKNIGLLIMSNLPDGTSITTTMDNSSYSEKLSLKKNFYWNKNFNFPSEPFVMRFKTDALPQFAKAKGIKTKDDQVYFSKIMKFYISDSNSKEVYNQSMSELQSIRGELLKIATQSDKIENSSQKKKFYEEKILPLQKFVTQWKNLLDIKAKDPQNEGVLKIVLQGASLLDETVGLMVKNHQEKISKLVEEKLSSLDFEEETSPSPSH